MKDVISLTEAEWKIIQVLWDKSPLTMMEVTHALETETGWTKHTVITLLKRMQSKGTVHIGERDGIKTYAPAVKKQQVAREQTRTLLSRLFSGRAAMLVSNLVEQGDVTEDEIREMMEILKRASKE